MADPEFVDATVYLQVAPEYNQWVGVQNRDKPSAIVGAKVVNSTQSRSQKPKPGTVEVKIAVRIPKGAFLPLRPEAIVIIPESMTQPHPVEVEALDANETGAQQ